MYIVTAYALDGPGHPTIKVFDDLDKAKAWVDTQDPIWWTSIFAIQDGQAVLVGD